MADIFDEVSEELRADRAKALLRRYGGVVAAAMVLLLAGIVGVQFWRARQADAAQAIASQFLDAMRKSDGAITTPGAPATPSAENRQQATEEFMRLAATAPEGYRTLARLRAAALRAEAGDKPGALALWDQVMADGAADRRLRDLAGLLWVQHQIDTGDPAALEARLRPLQAPDGAWRSLAEESGAWLALRSGQADKAKETLRRLAADASAPDGVRGRSSGLLAQLGEPPAPPPATAPGAVPPPLPSVRPGGAGGAGG